MERHALPDVAKPASRASSAFGGERTAETAIEGGIDPDEPQRLVYFWKVLTQRLIYFWTLLPDPPSRDRIVDFEPSEEFRPVRSDSCEFVFEARVNRHRDVIDPVGLRDISERRAHRSVSGR